MRLPWRHRRGREAEARARRHLERAGLRTLARNWRARGGEIDLVMADGAAVVFVEVRARGAGARAGAAESVDARKRARLVRAARAWLAREPGAAARPARFDVVTVEADGRLRWLRDAFRPAGDGV